MTDEEMLKILFESDIAKYCHNYEFTKLNREIFYSKKANI